MDYASQSDKAGSDDMRFSESQNTATRVVRLLGWSLLALMAVFVLNNMLNFGAGFPGAFGPSKLAEAGLLSWAQTGLYLVAVAVSVLYISRTPNSTLREDSDRVTSINTFFIRAAFWAVLLVGLVDMTIAFLRVENLMHTLVGEEMNSAIGRSHFRGPYIHMPVLAVGVILAFFTRTLGFHWLSLLIVIAELLIVISRFIFSYEQPFFSDLVRFWYGALFLFASAYTLLEEGHVRVDVFYASFREKTKGMVNMVGSLFMGVVLCWTILLVGMQGKTSIINAPVFNFETTQSGVGMYVKYMMAAFLAVFAISMMVQFVSYMFGSVADMRGEPGKRETEGSGAT